MRLKNAFKNEFGEIEGTAFFPYFNKEIDVICRGEAAPEYIEKCLKYLEEADEVLISRICRYAEFFLKDMLENTSVGETGGGEAFPYDNRLDLLKYIHFETLYIEAPPKSIADSSEIRVLNLAGSCDWQEDEGLQCLVRDGSVVYLGYFEDLSVWGDYSERYIGNYVLYESCRERLKQAKENMVTETHGGQMRTQRFLDRLNEKGARIKQKIVGLAHIISAKENISCGEAYIALEDSYLCRLMNEYPLLLDESIDFLYECYCIEKERDIGELARYISENCEWDMF